MKFIQSFNLISPNELFRGAFEYMNDMKAKIAIKLYFWCFNGLLPFISNNF